MLVVCPALVLVARPGGGGRWSSRWGRPSSGCVPVAEATEQEGKRVVLSGDYGTVSDWIPVLRDPNSVHSNSSCGILFVSYISSFNNSKNTPNNIN